ncbi:MAG: alpha/beta fold hydrolase [Desulfobacterales bacterium]|nr:alpha/beta fold hydrolase [Desulfobacterales bacterium]
MSTDHTLAGFIPPFYLRSAMLQSFLGSNRPGRRRAGPMISSARPLIIDTEGGVRLSGALSLSAAAPARGLMILLHGWEGSIDSSYVTATAQHLFHHGFSIFRLNFRDHGNSHSLNKGLFYATLLDEVYQAVMTAARITPGIPVFLCGFSLGGNFALRIARKWSLTPPRDIDLKHVIAISPVLDPSKATDAIDNHRIIRRYFLKKWQRSLEMKQQLFPERYDFTEILALSNIRQMTEKLLRRYSPYPNAAAYFAGYTLCGRDLEAISIPTTIITSKDDPIIPVEDFYHLSAHKHLRLMIHLYGGHNGFITNWRGRTWYERYLLDVVD